MKKKIIIAAILIITFFSAALLLINKFYLPAKIKSLIVSGIEEQTQHKVTLDDLKFSLFRGMVLKNLKIYLGDEVVISVKSASSSFFIWPFFKLQMIIPSLTFRDTEVSLVRRSDNTFNLQELFIKERPKKTKNKFNIAVLRVNFRNTRVNFQDKALKSPFTKSFDLNLSLGLSLPAKVRFSFKAAASANPKETLTGAGEYRVPQKSLSAKFQAHGLLPNEFRGYYAGSGISFPQGIIEASGNIAYKDDILQAESNISAKELTFDKQEYSVKASFTAALKSEYGFKDKTFKYSGNVLVSGAQISGLEFIETINDLNGDIIFDNAGFSSQKLTANVLGLPVEFSLRISKFKTPAVDIKGRSQLNLSYVKSILKEKLGIIIPADIQGGAQLAISAHSDNFGSKPLEIAGLLEIPDANVKLEKIQPPFENVRGKLEFTNNQLKWSDLNFLFYSTSYKSSGTFTDFNAPGVNFELSSDKLDLKSTFAVNNKIITLTKLDAKFINSTCSALGKIDISEPSAAWAELSADLGVNLEDLAIALPQYAKQLKKISPKGRVLGKLNLTGNLKDFKNCSASVNLSGEEIFLYGLKAQGLTLSYNQLSGIAEVAPLHASLYGGTLDIRAKMNLSSNNLPYWAEFDMQNISLQELKLNGSGKKEKEISGTLKAHGKINGFSNDLSKLNGAGEIFITNGNLWHLDLFKGMGALIFTNDFNQIVFTEGYCAFNIQDKFISSDSIKMKSTLADLSGNARIGFDGSLEAAFDVQVSPDAPLSGTFKDVTTAIAGQAGRFGIIKISGTLKEPKYKFKADVMDIIKGLKDMFLKN